MIKVVLDTNVLISGTFWSSSSFQILRLVDAEKILLIVSPEILSEYDELLHREEILEKSAYSAEKAQAVTKILTKAVLVEPQIKITVIKEDPDDNKFLEAAIAGSAQHIITKDKKHILPLKEFKGIQIVTPEEFLVNVKI